MIPLVLRRLAGLLILTLSLPLLTLLMLRLIPGDFCRATLPETASLAIYQQCQQQLPSLGKSYYHTLSRLAQGDLGNSLQGHHRPVATDLATHLPSTDNIILRLDSGQVTNTSPKAIGLTFISFSYLMTHYRSKPIMVSLTNLRHLPEPLWQAVLNVTTTPPVADFLEIGLSLSPRIPPLPEMAMNY